MALQFMARREEWSGGVSLYARESLGGDVFAYAHPMVMERYERPIVAEPFARIDIQAAQQLMDELWECGLRPSEGTGSAGMLKATQDHLNDMRKIASKKLGVEL